MAGALWKPSSERDGNLVILFPYEAGEVTIRDAETGEVLATGRSTGPSNDFADTIRFDQPGSAFNNVIVEDSTGRSISIGNGANRHDNIDVGDAGETTDAGDGTPDDSDGSQLPGGLGVAPPLLVDPSIIQANPIDFPVIPQPNFNFTDPIENTREVGDFNREQSARNFALGLERAGIIQEQELEDVIKFASGISEEQLKLLDVENEFARGERIESAEAAIPGVQELFKNQRERAETLAGGQFLDTAEDRAFELASRSAAAEGTVIRGFGDDSVVGKSAAEQLSAKDRLQVSQIGEGFLNNSIQLAAGLLFDTPTKPNVAQRLPAQPSLSTAQLTTQQQGVENALTTIAPQAALQATIQQETFKTDTERIVNQFNANGVFDARKFNSTQEFNATLARAGLTVGNINAINEFNQGVLDDIRAQEEKDKLQAELDEAFEEFKKNKNRKEFFESIGAIYAGLQNAPDFVTDLIREAFGDTVADAWDRFRGKKPPGNKSPDSKPSGGGGSGSGGGRGDGGSSDDDDFDDSDRAPDDGPFDETPPEDRPPDTGADGDDADDEFDDDFDDDGEFPETDPDDLPPGTDPDQPAPDEGGTVIDEDAAERRYVRNAKVNVAELNLSLARIGQGMELNTGVIIGLNVRDSDEFIGII